jgi:large subunit ribosomal protein L15
MLHSLKAAPGSRKSSKRAGRGNSAGRGTTAGRGTKGQGSRSGSSRNRIFEGGQTPLLQRQPKFGGFKNPNRIEYEVVNVADLEETLSAGKYDVESLKEHKLVSTGKRVKLLARGEVKKKFDLTVHAASKSATEAIEKAGGKVTVLI